MKYIRTKHNIFEVIEETDLVYRVIAASRERNNIYSKSKCNTEVVKQANTIEELCDEFMIKFNDEENHIELHKQMKKDDLGWEFNDMHNIPRRHISPWYLNNPFEIYGAIWTDKGLIYVAKMNDKGELELL